jgi:ADP-heptose:LPS heptosyltransferase
MIRSDCVHYKGETPCAFKRPCDGCPHVRPFGRTVLLIKRAAMGDVLRTTALLPGLKRKYPDGSIFWVVDEESADLLRANPLIDRIIPFTAEHLLQLAVERFDALICLDKDRGATALAVRVEAKAKFGFGMNEHGNLVALNPAADYALRLGIDDDLKFHKNTKTYQEIIAEAAEVDYHGDPYIFNLTAADRSEAADFFRKARGSKRPKIGLNTGAGSKFLTKQWPAAHYRKLIRSLIRDLGAEVYLLGGAREKALNADLAKGASGRVHHTGTGHSLRQFAGFVEAMDAVVTSDTLGMHIAIALGRPVVALFGPTAPQEITLYGRGAKLFAGAPCAPCYKQTCADMACMSEITPAQVFAEIQKAL